jgi:hypothetical protein
MDATQKKRIRKVAIAHFLLALFVFWKLIHYMAWSGPREREVWFMVWNGFWTKVFMLFEPQLFLFGLFQKYSIHFPPLVALFIFIISIPVWSYYFSWIFVKLDNWLNHFPVLGKRVF